ncbi:hypothetical protein ABPG75_012086 [Micractinium tetrahymenae]
MCRLVPIPPPPRYHICQAHMAAPEVDRDGVPSRFCQQCGRFHGLAAFDGTQRSCREQLANHNSRRRFRRSHAASSDREEWDGDSEALLAEGYVPRATTKRLRNKREREAAAAAAAVQRAEAPAADAQQQQQQQQQQQHNQLAASQAAQDTQARWAPAQPAQPQAHADWQQLALLGQAGLLLQHAVQAQQAQQAAQAQAQQAAQAQAQQAALAQAAAAAVAAAQAEARPPTESGGSSSMQHSGALLSASVIAPVAQRLAQQLSVQQLSAQQLSAQQLSADFRPGAAAAAAAQQAAAPKQEPGAQDGAAQWGCKRQRQSGSSDGLAAEGAAHSGSGVVERDGSQPLSGGPVSAFRAAAAQLQPSPQKSGSGGSGEGGGGAAAAALLAQPGRVERSLSLPTVPAGAAQGIAAFQLQRAPAAATVDESAPPAPQLAPQQQPDLAALLQASPVLAAALAAATAAAQQPQQGATQQQSQQWALPPVSSSPASAYSTFGLGGSATLTQLSQHLSSAGTPTAARQQLALSSALAGGQPSAVQLAAELLRVLQPSQPPGALPPAPPQQPAPQQAPGGAVAAALRMLEQQRAQAEAAMAEQHLSRLLAVLQAPQQQQSTLPALSPVL